MISGINTISEDNNWIFTNAPTKTVRLIRNINGYYSNKNGIVKDDSFEAPLEFIQQHQGEAIFEMLGVYDGREDPHGITKLYIDLDDKAGVHMSNPLGFLYGYIDGLIIGLNKVVGKSITRDDFAISESNSDKIVSYHIVLLGFKIDRMLIKQLLTLCDSITNHVDLEVYSKSRKFRCIGMKKGYLPDSKTCDNRIMKPINYVDNLGAHVIQYLIGDEILITPNDFVVTPILPTVAPLPPTTLSLSDSDDDSDDEIELKIQPVCEWVKTDIKLSEEVEKKVAKKILKIVKQYPGHDKVKYGNHEISQKGDLFNISTYWFSNGSRRLCPGKVQHNGKNNFHVVIDLYSGSVYYQCFGTHSSKPCGGVQQNIVDLPLSFISEVMADIKKTTGLQGVIKEEVLNECIIDSDNEEKLVNHKPLNDVDPVLIDLAIKAIESPYHEQFKDLLVRLPKWKLRYCTQLSTYYDISFGFWVMVKKESLFIAEIQKELQDLFSHKKLEFDKNSSDKNIVSMAALKIGAKKKISTFDFLKKVLALAEGDPLVKIDNLQEILDTNPYLFAYSDGTIIDLKTFEYRKVKPNDYISTHCGYPYEPAKEEHKDGFETFISQIYTNPDIRRFVQKTMGYNLLSASLENMFWIFQGNASNGKTKMIALIQETFGLGKDNYTIVGDNAFIYKMKFKRDASAHNAADVLNKNKKIIIFDEPEATESLDNEKIKKITGGKLKQTVRAAYGQYIDVDITYGMFFLCNDTLRMNGSDGGVTRRGNGVPHTSKFYKNQEEFEQFSQMVTPDMLFPADSHIQDNFVYWKFHCMNWMLDGLKMYYDERFTNIPQIITQYTKKIFLEHCPVQRFISMELDLEASNNQYVKLTEVWSRFNKKGYNSHNMKRGQFDDIITKLPQFKKGVTRIGSETPYNSFIGCYWMNS